MPRSSVYKKFDYDGQENKDIPCYMKMASFRCKEIKLFFPQSTCNLRNLSVT